MQEGFDTSTLLHMTPRKQKRSTDLPTPCGQEDRASGISCHLHKMEAETTGVSNKLREEFVCPVCLDIVFKPVGRLLSVFPPPPPFFSALLMYLF
jgi:hypothetical protein